MPVRDDAAEDAHAELERLRKEVARLKAENVSLRRQTRLEPTPPSTPSGGLSPRSAWEKVALFRSLFAGRTDVYPVRWENAAGRSGYSPACRNEWVVGICGKPAVKCSTCPNSAFKEVTDEVILNHLKGRLTAGVYPLLPGDICQFLAVDFDEGEWRADALAFAQTARAAGIPVALEISRSGSGAHAWTFFAEAMPAEIARRLGTALLTATCRERRQLRLTSYDRLFPSQDRLPAGGFGNLIALPLQAEPRRRGGSVFVDDDWRPYADPWSYLASIERLSASALEAALARLAHEGPELDAALLTEEEIARPWARRAPAGAIAGPAPERLRLTQAQQVFVEKNGLSPRWIHRLVRLATFQNPAFYEAQARRRSVWNTPRLITCAENHPQHIALPRGVCEGIEALASSHGVAFETTDLRSAGRPLRVRFTGTLAASQSAALTALVTQDTGLLCAATGFGKTVVAAAVIGRRAVSTLVLVHRAELLMQWRARLNTFLEGLSGRIGVLGAGAEKLSGAVDVALLQTLVRRLDTLDLGGYGQVIVDECHHIPAESFERVLKALPARYVIGLTATPVRRDGKHPILFMQIGPIRYRGAQADAGVAPPEVRVERIVTDVELTPDAPIQTMLGCLAHSSVRAERIAGDVLELVQAGRRVLLLTERTDHLDALAARLESLGEALFCLHGRMSARVRAQVLDRFRAWRADRSFVLLATGRLIGEGFDDPRLDALVLALPFSWKGTLQQYVGRLSRPWPGKPRGLVLDYLDGGVPVLERMAARRRAGYAAIGARVLESATSSGSLELPLS
ncbi:MAG: TOTE conflict system archaeo-eukaryotic primase domain-containing protein [Steroidobacteraceae bacterium]